MSIPYMPLYVTDYEADTAHLSLEEDGVYVRLLRLCWRTPGCNIPDDPAWITRMMRATAEDYERVIGPIISEFFRAEKGRLSSPRLTKEFERITETSEKRRAAGSKGGRPAKRLKTNASTESRAKANQKHLEPEPEPEEETYVSSLIPAKAPREPDRFPEFWDLFAHKVEKPKAIKAWAKAIKKADPDAIMDGVRRYLPTRNPGYFQAPHRWLEAERWTDEPAISQQKGTTNGRTNRGPVSDPGYSARMAFWDARDAASGAGPNAHGPATWEAGDDDRGGFGGGYGPGDGETGWMDRQEGFGAVVPLFREGGR